MNLTLICRDDQVAHACIATCQSSFRVSRLAPDAVDQMLRVDVAPCAVDTEEEGAVVLLWNEGGVAELLPRLRARIGGFGVPLIVLCREAGDEMATALLAGADAALTLPLDARVLKAQIQRYRKRWEATRSAQSG